MKNYVECGGLYELNIKSFMNTVSPCYKQMSEAAIEVLEARHLRLTQRIMLMNGSQRQKFMAAIGNATVFELSQSESNELAEMVEKFVNVEKFDYFEMLEELKEFFMKKDGYTG